MGKKKTTKDRPGTFASPAGIMRGTRPYICIRQFGEVDENGRSVFSVGYSGKIIGKPDKPFSSLACAMVAFVSEHSQPGGDDPEADLQAFKDWVANLRLVRREPQEEPT